MFKIDFFKLSPRLGRIEHLGLFSFWLGIAATGAFLNIFIKKAIPDFYNLLAIPLILLVLIGLINILFLKIRRLNDFNYSGWWILVGAIPVLGAFWILAIFCIPGTNGNNQFGTPPTNPSGWHYLLILTAPIVYLIFYLFGIYDLT